MSTGLSSRQRTTLAQLATATTPQMPDDLGTTWRTLRGLKKKGLLDWKRFDDATWHEGAVITDAGRRRLI